MTENLDLPDGTMDVMMIHRPPQKPSTVVHRSSQSKWEQQADWWPQRYNHDSTEFSRKQRDLDKAIERRASRVKFLPAGEHTPIPAPKMPEGFSVFCTGRTYELWSAQSVVPADMQSIIRRRYDNRCLFLEPRDTKIWLMYFWEQVRDISRTDACDVASSTLWASGRGSLDNDIVIHLNNKSLKR